MPASKKKTEEKKKQKEQKPSIQEEPQELPVKKVEEPTSAEEPKEETSTLKVEVPSSSTFEPIHEAQDAKWPSSQVAVSPSLSEQAQPTPESEAITSQEPKTESTEESPDIEGGRPIVVAPEKKNNLWVFIVLIVLGLALGAALFFFRGAIGKFASGALQGIGVKKATVALTPIVKKEPTISPTITPEKVDLSKYAITVLNGSGIKGEAAKLKESLENEGFTVSSAGNADASDYEKTIVKAKEDVEKGFLDKLKSILSKSYSVASIQELEKDDKDEVVIIIGSEKAE